MLYLCTYETGENVWKIQHEDEGLFVCLGGPIHPKEKHNTNGTFQ